MQHPGTPVHLTKLPAPARRPSRRRTPPRPLTDGSLALAPEIPIRPTLHAVPETQHPAAARGRGAGGGGGGGPTVGVGGVEPPEVGRIVRLVVEALVGARGLRQVAPWVTPEVAWELSRPKAARRLMSAPRVVAWRVQRPGERVAEVSAVAEVGGRFHAVALRLEPMRGRWRCAAIETTIPLT